MPTTDDPPGISVTEWTSLLARLDLSSTVKAVGTRLALYADYRTGRSIHPGTEQLASATSLSDRTVRRALDELRDTGLIVRTFQGSTAGRRGLADEYRLAHPADLLERVRLLPTGREHRSR